MIKRKLHVFEVKGKACELTFGILFLIIKTSFSVLLKMI